MRLRRRPRSSRRWSNGRWRWATTWRHSRSLPPRLLLVDCREILCCVFVSFAEIACSAYRWIDYHHLSVETEKEHIRKAVTSLKALAGYTPRGWYYGRDSAHSRT